MNAVTRISRFAVVVAACMLLGLSFSTRAEGGHPDATGRFDPHGLGDVNSNPVPLLSFTLSASTDVMKGNSMDLVASWRGVGLTENRSSLQYQELTHEFSIQAPRIKALDFSKAIREKVETSPEKLLDRLIVDGNLSFSVNW